MIKKSTNSIKHTKLGRKARVIKEAAEDEEDVEDAEVVDAEAEVPAMSDKTAKTLNIPRLFGKSRAAKKEYYDSELKDLKRTAQIKKDSVEKAFNRVETDEYGRINHHRSKSGISLKKAVEYLEQLKQMRPEIESLQKELDSIDQDKLSKLEDAERWAMDEKSRGSTRFTNLEDIFSYTIQSEKLSKSLIFWLFNIAGLSFLENYDRGKVIKDINDAVYEPSLLLYNIKDIILGDKVILDTLKKNYPFKGTCIEHKEHTINVGAFLLYAAYVDQFGPSNDFLTVYNNILKNGESFPTYVEVLNDSKYEGYPVNLTIKTTAGSITIPVKDGEFLNEFDASEALDAFDSFVSMQNKTKVLYQSELSLVAGGGLNGIYGRSLTMESKAGSKFDKLCLKIIQECNLSYESVFSKIKGDIKSFFGGRTEEDYEFAKEAEVYQQEIDTIAKEREQMEAALSEYIGTLESGGRNMDPKDMEDFAAGLDRIQKDFDDAVAQLDELRNKVEDLKYRVAKIKTSQGDYTDASDYRTKILSKLVGYQANMKKAAEEEEEEE